MIKKTYPGVRHVIMGHSMGSYFTRKFLTKYGELTDGAIIMGTGIVPAAVAGFGQTVAQVICKVKGSHYRSKLLVDLSLGSNNKKIKNPRTSNEWLSRNEEDPVGSYGTAVTEISEQYKAMGMEKVSLILYPEERHEILNEKACDKVYADILTWLNENQ